MLSTQHLAGSEITRWKIFAGRELTFTTEASLQSPDLT